MNPENMRRFPVRNYRLTVLGKKSNNDNKMDHVISTRRPGQVIVNKEQRTCKIVDFNFPADH